MTASATETPPAVNPSTIECSQVLVDNPVAEIKDDPATVEETLPAAAVSIADENPKKRASPESKDDPEAKKLDAKEDNSPADNDDEQVAIVADVVPEEVVATHDDELRANLELASDDNAVDVKVAIETDVSPDGPECHEACNKIAAEEIDAGSTEEFVVSITNEDEIECCA